jgi:hypothetical protein
MSHCEGITQDYRRFERTYQEDTANAVRNLTIAALLPDCYRSTG